MSAHSVPVQELKVLAGLPAISGYESGLAQHIRELLAQFHPATDNLGDVLVTIGSGAPQRLIVAPIDEPGFVVSDITDDGYLRLQRLSPSALPPVFNDLYAAQPVKVGTAAGEWIDGVVAGISIHLAPGRADLPKASDLENMYIDIGAASAAEVRKAGVDLLSPVVIDREIQNLGGGKMAGAAIGDRFGAAALLNVLQRIDPSKIKGTVTFAFVTQQWTGARGLQRVLTAVPAGEMIYVGRLIPGGPVPGIEGVHRAPRREPGSGVLLGLEQANGIPAGLAGELKQTADANKIPFATDFSAPLAARNYSSAPAFPAKSVHLAIATGWSDTPAEILDAGDLALLEDLLALYAQGSVAPAPPVQFTGDNHLANLIQPHFQYSNAELLRRLVLAYGPSDREQIVREDVEALLPAWAKPETDDAGNLILRLGASPPGAKAPAILFVAHLDEIGFAVKSIADDGRLEVEPLGAMDLSYYLGHPALVHTAGGDLPAIMELPTGWDEPGFQWIHWPAPPGKTIRVDVGARTRADAQKLGIAPGDTVTIPKSYRPLQDARANGRSLDDRVGCASLISAVWALGAPLKDRDVTFVWSTAEELGLKGAAALAQRLSKQGREPGYVFAIDTFVSSDSPFESRRFAGAEIGKGFVVRAIDDSNIAPRNDVERVVKLARANRIPVQFGVTGGGNDGSAFLRYGSVDIPLGWPLRYSHSPGEVIDTRDLDALARIVAVLARSW